jgi:hypothetical protein
MTKEECLIATNASNTLGTDMVDDTTYINNPELVSSLEEEMMVWGYMMMQYNLKARLQKFGDKGKTAAMEEIMQLYIMDTWKAMNPAKLSWEQQMQVLSLLLFLKEKLLEERYQRAPPRDLTSLVITPLWIPLLISLGRRCIALMILF